MATVMTTMPRWKTRLWGSKLRSLDTSEYFCNIYKEVRVWLKFIFYWDGSNMSRKFDLLWVVCEVFLQEIRFPRLTSQITRIPTNLRGRLNMQDKTWRPSRLGDLDRCAYLSKLWAGSTTPHVVLLCKWICGICRHSANKDQTFRTIP